MTSTPLKTSDISIIIPTLNEAGRIEYWRELHTQVQGHSCEIILVDGGSSDQTVALARGLGFRVETCRPGRGAQLNYGAKVADGRILLFLHADTRMPAAFPGLILASLKNSRTLAGAFSLAIEQAGPALQCIARCATLRSRLFRLPYGDQALFIRRDDFWRLGGFPETPVMEDFLFIRRIRKKGGITILPQCVTTSARRWQRLGLLRTTLINQLMILGYYAGVPLSKLASLYRR